MVFSWCTLFQKQGRFPSTLLECIWEQIPWQVISTEILTDLYSEKYQDAGRTGGRVEGGGGMEPGEILTNLYRQATSSWVEGRSRTEGDVWVRRGSWRKPLILESPDRRFSHWSHSIQCSFSWAKAWEVWLSMMFRSDLLFSPCPNAKCVAFSLSFPSHTPLFRWSDLRRHLESTLHGTISIGRGGGGGLK